MKFKLTSETKVFSGKTLYRIEALIDFGIVKKGEIGGYVEKEKNLSQNGDAWVSGNARVSGNAWISGNAQVYGEAWVFGDARVSGRAQVYGDAWISGNAQVFGENRNAANVVDKSEAWDSISEKNAEIRTLRNLGVAQSDRIERLEAACRSALDVLEGLAVNVDTNPWIQELSTALDKGLPSAADTRGIMAPAALDVVGTNE